MKVDGTRLRGAGLRPLEEAFPQLGEPGNYDAYQALDVIKSEMTRNDLILVDPFADFLKPDANGCNRAEHVLPVLGQIANCSTVLLFVLNGDPFNRVGRRFDELLRDHVSSAFTMSCPPIHDSKVNGGSKYYADFVLAGPELVGEPSEAAYLRCRLELLARKTADALGLSERGARMLRHQAIGGFEQLRHTARRRRNFRDVESVPRRHRPRLGGQVEDERVRDCHARPGWKR